MYIRNTVYFSLTVNIQQNSNLFLPIRVNPYKYSRLFLPFHQ